MTAPTAPDRPGAGGSDALGRARRTIIAAWAAASAVSVLVAVVRPGNALDAAIALEDADGAPVLVIRNAGDGPWERARLLVNDRWRAEIAVVPRDGAWVLGALDLVDRHYVPLELGDPWLAGAPGLEPDRARPPADLRVETVRLEVGDEAYERRFEPGDSPAASD